MDCCATAGGHAWLGRHDAAFAAGCHRLGGFGGSGPGTQHQDYPTAEEASMGLDDKAKNKAEELKGQAKETTGRVTDDEELEAEGQTDQAKGDLKQAGEKVKDAFKR